MAPYTNQDDTLEDVKAQIEAAQAGRAATIAAAPNFDPATFAEKDEGVASRVTGLMQSDNPLMRQAETAGLQKANRRGLLNSSVAVGAAQNEAYRVALPIAQQEAAQASSYNALSREIGSREKMAAAEQVAAKQRLGMELDSREMSMLAEMAAAKQRLGMQLTSQEQTALADREAATERLGMEIGSREAMQLAEIAAAKDRLGMQLSSQEMLALEQMQASNWQTAAQIRSSAQQTLTQSNTQAYNVYQSAIASIQSNTTMSAAAKQRAVTNARNHYNNTLTRNQRLYRSALPRMP